MHTSEVLTLSTVPKREQWRPFSDTFSVEETRCSGSSLQTVENLVVVPSAGC